MPIWGLAYLECLQWNHTASALSLMSHVIHAIAVIVVRSLLLLSSILLNYYTTFISLAMDLFPL